MIEPNTVVAIVGPTGVGKSSLAQSLAVALSGEVLSADSMQIYKEMNIGTAKLMESQRLVAHHGIDIITLSEPFSAAEYQRYARRTIDDCFARCVQPIVCGGTGLYIRAALDTMEFPAGEMMGNPIRQHYEHYLEINGALALWEQLEHLDFASASLLHPNNTRRVVRALEMHHQGVSYASQVSKFNERTSYYPTVYIGLNLDRTKLYARINQRVDEMIQAGLVVEVERLIESGFSQALTAIQAIGYKELVPVITQGSSLDEAVDSIKQSSRRYAKRQFTWFRSDPRIVWLDVDDVTLPELTAQALSYL